MIVRRKKSTARTRKPERAEQYGNSVIAECVNEMLDLLGGGDPLPHCLRWA